MGDGGAPVGATNKLREMARSTGTYVRGMRDCGRGGRGGHEDMISVAFDNADIAEMLLLSDGCVCLMPSEGGQKVDSFAC